MRSLHTCILCTGPLPDGSLYDLCPKCRSAPDTSQSGFATPLSILARGGSLRVNPQATAVFEPDRVTGSCDFSLSVATSAETASPEAGSDTPITHPVAPGGYDIFRRIGTGGMADVYLAREHATERLVAIKFLRAAGNPTAVDRFLAEVRALARIDHPHIVRVLAADFYRLQPYFSMEYVPGGSLSEHVHRYGPMAPADAARVMVTVARAVAAAHAADVLHRDLKPSNILLFVECVRDEGSGVSGEPTIEPSTVPATLTPKVSDFGLAKRTDRDDDLTLGTGTLGTPSYMPPEQISRRNGDVGPQSDVYGLGATLYHLLTGRPPFTGSTAEEIMTAVLTEPLSRPRALRPEIPLPLEAVVVRCLEKDPADRYASATAVAEDLERCLVGQKPVAPQLTRWRRTRRWASRNRVRFTAAILAVGLATGLVFAGRAFVPRPAILSRSQQVSHEAAIAEIQAELASGQEFTLVDENGRARYRRWVLGDGRFLDPTAGTAACWCRDRGMLELCPDPGIDHYRVTAQVRQLESAGRVEGTGLTGYSVGFYLGFDHRKAADGTGIYTFSSLMFSDYCTGGKRTRQSIDYDDFLLVEMPVKHPSGIERGLAAVRTAAVPDLPGPWRQFEFEMSPKSMLVRFGLELPNPPPAVRYDLAGLQLRNKQIRDTMLMHHSLMPYIPDVERVGWSPRRPFGVWVNGAAAEVRNVVITPLPRPMN